MRLCQQVVVLANQKRFPISICGEIASDPIALPVLAGLGLRALSVTATAIPTIKEAIRKLSLSEMTPEKIARFLEERVGVRRGER
jgi:phosphoenolpyruvate-protein kinase (PTS system EI component)